MSKYISWASSQGCYLLRLFGTCFYLKSPKEPRYFSERMGYNKPTLEMRGWRLWIKK